MNNNISFKNPITGEEFNLNDYLVSFVNEDTGEIDESRKVLDKRIRKQWACAYYKNALFVKKEVDLNVTPASASVIQPGEDIEKLSSMPREAVAHVQLFLNGEVIAEDYARRRADGDGGFEFYLEAAINAALDRALIDLGFVISGEFVKTLPPQNGENPPTTTSVPETSAATPAPESKAAQKKKGRPRKVKVEENEALSGFSALLDEAGIEPNNSPTTEDVAFDKATPVEEIMRLMSPAQARAYVLTIGKYAGQTLGEVYERDKDRDGHSRMLAWYARNIANDNILVAACRIINK